MKMKQFILGFVLLLAGTTLFSQTLDDYMEVQREALKAEKKAIVAEAMQFTDTESEAFWPLYNEYNNKMYVHNTELYKLIKKFAANYELMPHEDAISLWNGAMKVEQDLLNLEKQYFKKFLKILPGRKAMRYFQVESKIKNIIDAELAMEIPLVEE
jgi:hypothetical protein